MQVSIVSVAKLRAYCSEPFHITERGALSPTAQFDYGGLCGEATREEMNEQKRVS